jgi:hypothetical protein
MPNSPYFDLEVPVKCSKHAVFGLDMHKSVHKLYG